MNEDELNTIDLFVNAIEKEKNAQIFLTPVDYVGLNLPDYLTVVTKPMDISTIRKKIEDNEYSSTDEIHKDIQLIWDNCKKYNIEGSEVFKMAQYCEKYTKRFFDKHNKFQQIKNSNEKGKKNGTNKASNRKGSNTDTNQAKETSDIKEEGKKEEVVSENGKTKRNDHNHQIVEEEEENEKEANDAETSNGLSAYEKVMLSNRVKKLQNDGLASVRIAYLTLYTNTT